MGNVVPPRMCRKDDDVATAAAAPDAVVAPRRAAVVTLTPRKQQGGDEKEGEATRRRRAGAVSWAGVEDTGAGKASGATVATVKIVLKRKDAEALVARLNAQSARERKARMAELKGELRTVECCGGGGGASPASCRDAWKPRLAPINEN